MGEFSATPVVATKWESANLVRGLKADISNILKNLESIYKDVYAFPAWDNDGSQNVHPQKTAAAAIAKGDACYFPSAGSIKPAVANKRVSARSIAIANTAVSNGALTRDYFYGPGFWSGDRYSFTVGSFVWVSVSTAGLLVTTPPSAASVNHAMGVAMTASQIHFQPFLLFTEI